ncbi:VOC family protein [Reinekea marina]|uniref:VOC family protein n=1 Tax=Reinekea marina TaxID=1310421 RepID=A0ABV7WRV4_9GAMM|nr:VOC family protein [Reinekea marina]MDN3650898.1 VOC family protein [Reinekea marina]
MIDHFEIKVVEFEKCLKFYSSALKPLGIVLKWSDSSAAGFGTTHEPNVRFLIEKSESSTKSHIAFKAKDEASVASFYEKGLATSGICNGKPGIREHYAPNYFAAFLFDPDGNNIEAVVYL